MKKFLNGPWVLLLPTIIILACVVFLPLLLSLWTSFTPFKLTKPDTLYRFVGLRNYERLIGDYDFWIAFGRTVLFLTIALNLELVFGLGIALLINKITYAQKTLRTLMMFPMMFSPILVGFQWKYIFNDNIGLLNNFLREFGVVNPYSLVGGCNISKHFYHGRRNLVQHFCVCHITFSWFNGYSKGSN